MHLLFSMAKLRCVHICALAHQTCFLKNTLLRMMTSWTFATLQMILLQVNSLKSSTYSVYSQKHFGIDTQPYCTRTHTYAHYNYLHILLDVQYEFKALRNVYIRRVSLYHQCISIFVHTTSTNASSISPFRCFLLYDVIIFFIIIASYPFV